MNTSPARTIHHCRLPIIRTVLFGPYRVCMVEGGGFTHQNARYDAVVNCDCFVFEPYDTLARVHDIPKLFTECLRTSKVPSLFAGVAQGSRRLSSAWCY